MRGSRSLRFGVVGLMLAVLAGLMPASAAALSMSAPVAIRWSGCDHGWQWYGDLYTLWGPASENRGKFDYCFVLEQIGTVDSYGRIQDGDSSADYYIVDQTVDWNPVNIGWSADNYAKLTVSSSIGAISGVYAATPYTITSSSCSWSALSVGVGFGPFSVSVSPVLCNNGTLRRDSYGYASAQWSSGNIVNTPHWETAFMVKVSQGAKPTFTARLTYPSYVAYKNGLRYCGGGYCIDEYSYTRYWDSDPWFVKAP